MRPSLLGYILFNIGLYLFHLPTRWEYSVLLIIFSLACILHHIYDPEFIQYEKYVLLFMVFYMEIFLYVYLLKLDIVYTKLHRIIPNLDYNTHFLWFYIVFTQMLLLTSIILVFTERKRVNLKKLYLV